MAPLFVGSNSDDSRIRSDRVGLAASTSNPASADTGDVYYNSTDNKLNVYDGSDWAEAGGGGTLSGIASGALTDGMPVIVQSDGTIRSVVQEVNNFSPIGVGTTNYIQNGSEPKYISVIYNTDQDLHVAFYEDETSSNLKGSVIQVIEDSVTPSVNTKLVSSRHPSETDAAFMAETSGANAVNAVFYTSGTTLYTMGSIISGDMDGATLTLGSEFSVQTSTPTTPRCIATNNTDGRTFVFYIRSADVMCRGISWSGITASHTGGGEQTVTTDSANTLSVAYNGSDKVLIAYDEGSNGKAVVGTISGEAISFGSAVTFSTGGAALLGEDGVSYDSTLDKFLIVYRDQGDSEDLKAIVATVSGTSATFGTATDVFTGSNNLGNVYYDPVGGKHAIVINDQANDLHKVFMATISGTSVTVDSGTGVAFLADQNKRMRLSHDIDQERFLALHRGNQTQKFELQSLKTSTITKYLTANNFIGFSDAAYSDGATATIQIAGAVDDAQSGLTTASVHYVQNDGTLSTSAGSPSVEAGLALSATEIAIKA